MWFAIGMCAIAVGFLTVGAGAAGAGPPLVCGTVITTSTTLQNNLINCPGDGIVIGAKGVTLNLNGHTIDGVGNLNSDGIDNGGYDGVVVKNGKVKQFGYGLYLGGGKYLDGATKNVVRRVIVSDNIFDGIYVDGLARADSHANRFVADRLLRNGEDGIQLVGSDHAVIAHNLVQGNGIRGIDANTSSVHNVIVSNVLVQNRDQGIWLSDLADRNLIKHNLVAENSSYGIVIFASNGNDVSRNAVRRNGGGIALVGYAHQPADANLLERNVVLRNGSHGIFLEGAEVDDPGATNTVVLANRAVRNKRDGIHVESPTTKITRNEAVRNALLGINAVAGVHDGGGNRARANGNPLQCVHVICS